MSKRSLIAASALAVVALAGCSRSEPEPAETQEAAPEPAAAAATPAPDAAAAPAMREEAEANASAAVEPPPAVPTAPDEQMMDDASTTGMTARAARDEEGTEGEPDAGGEDARATGNSEEP